MIDRTGWIAVRNNGDGEEFADPKTFCSSRRNAVDLAEWDDAHDGRFTAKSMPVVRFAQVELKEVQQSVRRDPDFTMTVHLVSHGYEASITVDGRVINSGCRDFADNRNVEEMRAWLVQQAEETLRRLREEYQDPPVVARCMEKSIEQRDKRIRRALSRQRRVS